MIGLFVVLAGIVVGVVSGLLPGVHTNLVAVIVAGFHADAWLSCLFLVAVAVSRSVMDAVPSVFLGASDDVMALLPGHRLLRKGFGVEAVKLSVLGSIFGVIGGIVLIPVLALLLPFLFGLLRPFLFWFLLFLVCFLLLRDIWWSVVVFALAGILGFLALQSIREPLFPLLSGLFGASGLLLSLNGRISVPAQHDVDVLRVRKRSLFCSAITGVLAGSIVTLFPGLGPSQAAALVQIKRMKSVQFLILTGALGTVDVIISLVTLFAVGKARNGAVVVVERLLGDFHVSALFAFVAVCLLAAGISSIFALFASKWYARLIEKIDYSLISACVLFFLLFMSFVLSGWLGVLVFLTASCIGLIAPVTKISRSHAMGCLLFPTLLMLW